MPIEIKELIIRAEVNDRAAGTGPADRPGQGPDRFDFIEIGILVADEGPDGVTVTGPSLGGWQPPGIEGEPPIEVPAAPEAAFPFADDWG